MLVGSTCDTHSVGSSEELQWAAGRDVARTKSATIHTLINAATLLACATVGELDPLSLSEDLSEAEQTPRP